MRVVGSGSKPRIRRSVLIAATAITAALIAMVVFAACGGGVAGTYKYESGTEEGMEQFTLTLNDDDTFELAGPNPVGGEDITMKGTYTVKDDAISLKLTDGDESDPGKIDGDKLVFETVTWVKE